MSSYLSQNRIERIPHSDGLNLFYKISAVSLLSSMSRFPSINLVSSLTQINKVLKSFEYMLTNNLNQPIFAGPVHLSKSGLLKKKHYNYGAYLAALSSFPILHRFNKNYVFEAIFAKTAEITSIKILDNIGDRLYEKSDAVDSQNKHLEAFTEKEFIMPKKQSFLGKAENSCYEIARWTFNTVWNRTPDHSFTWKIYLEDFQNYIDGQINSMSAKIKDEAKFKIKDYIQKVNEKSVGRVWIDIDFCLLEKALGEMNDKDMETIYNTRKAVDYFFKGCNIYDDVADLEEDLSLNITNSVVLLALDRGLIKEKDLEKDKKSLIEKLKNCKAIEDAIWLGDLIYIEGIKTLLKTYRSNEIVDVDGLIYGAKILRAFAIRKWMMHEKSISSFLNIIKSFGNHENIIIPDYIHEYHKYI
ncbi:hypothetical protein AC481_07335 [miscellaneous Crenarchaeota group archaeon SMTZ-80]|nr:MAG: hypothetical protein AC481_07335 [miscellaneous Crenarchaeota group archaeon SMTZ-80]